MKVVSSEISSFLLNDLIVFLCQVPGDKYCWVSRECPGSRGTQTPSPAHLGLSLSGVSGVHLSQISLISFHHQIPVPVPVPAIYNISFSCRGNPGINWTQRSYVNYANTEFYWPGLQVFRSPHSSPANLNFIVVSQQGRISCRDYR